MQAGMKAVMKPANKAKNRNLKFIFSAPTLLATKKNNIHLSGSIAFEGETPFIKQLIKVAKTKMKSEIFIISNLNCFFSLTQI